MAVLKIIRIGAAKGSNPSKGLAAALKYISNPEKTEDGNLVKSVNCRDTWKETYVDMMTTKKMFEKTDGSQGFHFVISFSPEENVSKHLCRVITDQFISGYLNDRYEVLSAIHTDTNHMHSHIVFNSVSSIDGKKYHCDKSEWRKIIMPKLNRICEQYHLNIMALEKEELKEYIYPEDQKPLFYGRRLSRDDWEKARAGHKTWADFAAADIDAAIKKCYT